MKDDLEFNVYFIELVQARPCLYDRTRPDYNNRSSQDAAWQQLSKLVNASVPECKEKWKNLRGSYTRHLKKSVQSDSNTKYVKPYYLAEHLSFLNGYTQTRPRKESSFMRVKSEEGEVRVSVESEESREAESPIPEEENVEFADMTDDQNFFTTTTTYEAIKPNNSDINSTMVDYFKAKTKLAKERENQNPDLSFFYSLLPDMKEMGPEQKRRFKIGVLTLANKILEENTNTSTTIH